MTITQQEWWTTAESNAAQRSTSRFGFRIFFVLLLFIQLTPAAPEPPLMNDVRAKFSSAKTIEASFTQKIWWAVREKEEQKTGRILIGQGDKFRVEIGDMTWVSDGTDCWQYSAVTGQVIIRRLADIDLAVHPSRIFSAYLSKSRYETVKEDSLSATVESVPDTAVKTPTGKISVVIRKKDVSISSITTRDRNGNHTSYEFKKVKLNAPLRNDIFTFAIPEKAQVLDARK
jgi:outer membrane lipoprotein carrier protein